MADENGWSMIRTVVPEDPQESAGSPYKAYVSVFVDFTDDGRLIPLRIVWENGREYTIDQYSAVGRRASLKAGGTGILYRCRVMGRNVNLFYEENGKWFVTRKMPKEERGCRQ